MTQYTLVRHSGYAMAANSAFEDAVEVCELNADQGYRVRAAGGLLFATREDAQIAEHAANYPNGSKQNGPHASGDFSTLRIAGAEVYIPSQRGRRLP